MSQFRHLVRLVATTNRSFPCLRPLLKNSSNVIQPKSAVRCLSSSTADEAFERLAIYKDPQKCPQPLDDDQYPKWLWTLLDPKLSREELYRHAQKLYDAGGYDAVFDGMSEEHLIRLFRLSSRERIKTNNSMRKGGRMF